MSNYPPQFAFLQPFASRFDLVVTEDECAAFGAALSAEERKQFVDLYAMLVRRGDELGVCEWIDEDVADEDVQDAQGEVWRLIVFLDYMARHKMVPTDLAETRFIKWDTREFDNKGNEW